MAKQTDGNVSKDEQVGFHKGALSTLAKEREELSKMVNVVEQIMQMHIGALKELGIDLENGSTPATKSKAKSKTNIDQLI